MRDIGVRAFKDCAALTDFTLLDGLEAIHDEAFAGCTTLTSVSFDAGLTTLGTRAFAQCSALADVTMPAGVAHIGSEVFADCPSLVRVTLTGYCPAFENRDDLDVIFDGSGLTHFDLDELYKHNQRIK